MQLRNYNTAGGSNDQSCDHICTKMTSSLYPVMTDQRRRDGCNTIKHEPFPSFDPMIVCEHFYNKKSGSGGIGNMSAIERVGPVLSGAFFDRETRIISEWSCPLHQTNSSHEYCIVYRMRQHIHAEYIQPVFSEYYHPMPAKQD